MVEEHHFIGLFFPCGIEEIFCTNSRGSPMWLWSYVGCYYAILKERWKKLRFNSFDPKKKYKY